MNRQGYPRASSEVYLGSFPPPYNPYYNQPPPGGNHTNTYPGQGYPYPYTYESPGGIYSEPMASSTYTVPGENPSDAFDFTEKSVRCNFLRKVYSILTVQLLICIGFVALFTFERKIQKYFEINIGYLFVALAVSFVLVIILSCCSSLRRKAPQNYICLFIFTVAFSFTIGLAAARFNVNEIMLALGMTGAITIGLTLFAFQTKIDFTGWGGALFSFLIILMVVGVFTIFFPSNILRTVYAGIGALVMSLYIIYDTQMMIGGDHKYSISPEEYVFAALTLYLDIVNLFLYILRLIGGRGGN